VAIGWLRGSGVQTEEKCLTSQLVEQYPDRLKKVTLVMKRLLLLLIFIFPICGWANSPEDLVTRDGLFYKKFSISPFDGVFTGQYQGRIKDGLPDGKWLIFYSNGHPAVTMHWSMGIQVRDADVYDKLGQKVGEGVVSSRETKEFRSLPLADFHEFLLQLWDQEVYEERIKGDCR
jgi:hypothetical protein